MQMDKGEIYRHYKNMQGKEKDKIEILSDLNDCSTRTIRQIIEEEREKEENLKVECEGSYHPDDNPYCKVTTRIETPTQISGKDISDWVVDVIYRSIDIVEAEIKTLKKALENREAEYKRLVNLLGGGMNE